MEDISTFCGLLVTSLGFKLRVGSLAWVLHRLCTSESQIHLWCNTCWHLGNQHGNQAILIYKLLVRLDTWNLSWEPLSHSMRPRLSNNLAIHTIPVYRDKGTPRKKGGGPVLLLQNYPHPLSLRGRGPYYFPTPLNTWAPSTRLPSPLLLFPLK